MRPAWPPSAGHLADRFTVKQVFTAGAAPYVVGYAVFAVGRSGRPGRVPAVRDRDRLRGDRGIQGDSEGLPDRLRANGFGLVGLTQAFGELGATLVAGLLWSLVSPTVAFGYAAVWMLGFVIASGLFTDRPLAPTAR